jgi:hypothetical protein
MTVAAFVGASRHVSAELPPGAYDLLRKQAEEALIIQVVDVKTVKERGGATKVTALCKVLQVERSATGLMVGKELSLSYDIPSKEGGYAGPRIAPIVEKGSVHPAFLQKQQGAAAYDLAAHGESFTMTPEE